LKSIGQAGSRNLTFLVLMKVGKYSLIPVIDFERNGITIFVGYSFIDDEIIVFVVNSASNHTVNLVLK
jgi:hypothetical protein